VARIIAGIGSSHVPAIGAAIDNGKTEEPYWKRRVLGLREIARVDALTRSNIFSMRK
jgi:protocatechuate 4,5-dioxygenase beta chain